MKVSRFSTGNCYNLLKFQEKLTLFWLQFYLEKRSELKSHLLKLSLSTKIHKLQFIFSFLHLDALLSFESSSQIQCDAVKIRTSKKLNDFFSQLSIGIPAYLWAGTIISVRSCYTSYLLKKNCFISNLTRRLFCTRHSSETVNYFEFILGQKCLFNSMTGTLLKRFSGIRLIPRNRQTSWSQCLRHFSAQSKIQSHLFLYASTPLPRTNVSLDPLTPVS